MENTHSNLLTPNFGSQYSLHLNRLHLHGARLFFFRSLSENLWKSFHLPKRNWSFTLDTTQIIQIPSILQLQVQQEGETHFCNPTTVASRKPSGAPVPRSPLGRTCSAVCNHWSLHITGCPFQWGCFQTKADSLTLSTALDDSSPPSSFFIPFHLSSIHPPFSTVLSSSMPLHLFTEKNSKWKEVCIYPIQYLQM